MKSYSSAFAFRRALEDRLNALSKAEGVDLQRMRRQLAFDRLLVRLFAEGGPPWFLKGGYRCTVRKGFPLLRRNSLNDDLAAIRYPPHHPAQRPRHQYRRHRQAKPLAAFLIYAPPRKKSSQNQPFAPISPPLSLTGYYSAAWCEFNCSEKLS